VTQLEIILRRVHPTISAIADDPLLLAVPSKHIQPFLAVIQRSAFRDEGSLFDSNPTPDRKSAGRFFSSVVLAAPFLSAFNH
jgi:hypothetical protein